MICVWMRKADKVKLSVIENLKNLGPRIGWGWMRIHDTQASARERDDYRIALTGLVEIKL